MEPQERRKQTHTDRATVPGELERTPHPPDCPVTLPFICLSYFEMGFCLLNPKEFKLVIISPKITSITLVKILT